MIVVTGASGHLGRLVVDELTKRVGPEEVVAAARDPRKAEDLAIEVRRADYDQPETLVKAFTDADKVLLISSSDPHRRINQHLKVVDAAKEVGASLVYTSATKADTADVLLVKDHRATEEYIAKAGVPHTVLRNNWYHEMYEDRILGAAASGVIIGSAGTGRIASAARQDYAAGAAVVLTTEGHLGQTYEFGGNTDWSLPELADTIAEFTGNRVTYQDVSAADYAQKLAGSGVPDPLPEILADVEVGIRRGWLADSPTTLSNLLGRPTEPITEYVKRVIGGAPL
jgi:NAD(P)H dehydrogenase (quinone)